MLKLNKPNEQKGQQQMKTVKPKNIIINSEPKQKIDDGLVITNIQTPAIIDEPSTDANTIEELMNNVLKENNYITQKENPNLIKIECYLTKRQFELWNKKGGEKWLKKALVGQANSGNRVRKRK